VRRTVAVRRFFRFAPVLLLGAENLAVFGRHYFGGYGFPWDFVGAYYAATAYWTEAVAHGGLSMWMPFQSMGYPFLLNLQTSLWYPPMWAFPLFRIPYTLHAAVVLQCLHVLAGALGMYALLRSTVRSRREALLGAFAFQLFGGFYSNAEHVDIVRSFAMLPWLFWVAVPPKADEAGFPWRLLVAPLFIFLLTVGGYPGNLLAALFLLAVFAALVLVRRRFDRIAVRWTAALGGSVGLGLMMAAIHLGPAFLFRAELIRYNDALWMRRAFLDATHLPGLVLEPAGMIGDISMISTFVGLAVLAGVALLSWPSLRRFWPWAAVGLLAAALAAGDSLPVHRFLRGLVAPLGYSRFPPSDYRGVVAVVLLILAAAGWRDVRLRRGGGRALTWRLIPLALFAGWSIDRIYAGRPFWPRPALAAGVFFATFAAILVWRESRMNPARAFVALLAAIALGGGLVLPRVEGWQVPDLIAICRLFSPTPARMHDAGVVVDPAVFTMPPASRPARTDGDGTYLASGYLTGSYVLGDFGGTVLRARTVVTRSDRLLGYMRREWLPILVEPPPESRKGNAEAFVPGLQALAAAAAPDPRVRQTHYGPDRVRYRVTTDRPLLLVENEIYFPGWSARAGDVELQAVRVNDSLRGWKLPAGSYELEASFRLPHLRLMAVITAAAWVVWLLLVDAARRRMRRTRR
jgi:hypothetical protein